MVRLVSHIGSQTFVILAMLGMVVNGLAYVPSKCSCEDLTLEVETTQAKPACCSSHSKSALTKKSCCVNSARCCCSKAVTDSKNSLCHCGDDCRCGFHQLPEPSIPQIPCSRTQESIQDLATWLSFNLTTFRDEHLAYFGKRLKASPGIYCTAQETCAQLSRFTC